MSLKDKLKPDAKQRVGKVVPCPKCGRDAEHFSANYIACERCDAPKPKAGGEPIQWSIRTMSEDLEEDTNPGYFYMNRNTSQVSHLRLYVCVSCKINQPHDPDLVANGARCPCGGDLRAYP